MLSLLTVSLLGFAILGAFTYHYGEIHDDSEASFSDIGEDYYPGDLKMVFIDLALVIPVALPIRLISKLNKILRFLAVAFTVKVMIGCAVGILTMVAMIRWSLSYLICTPLEFVIGELILAADCIWE